MIRRVAIRTLRPDSVRSAAPLKSVLQSWMWAGRLLLAAVLMVCGSATAAAQQSVAIRGDRLSGFVLPIEPVEGDISFQALRASRWTVDDTQRLLLEGDVQVRIGAYSFRSQRAVVWLNRLPSAGGVINQMAVYFDELANPTRQAGLGVAGSDLLVTGSARGEVSLNVAAQVARRESGPLVAEGEARLKMHLQKITAGDPSLARWPQVDREVAARETFVPVPGGRVTVDDLPELPTEAVVPPREERAPWLARPTGAVRFSAREVEIASGEEENVVTMTGPVVLEYIMGDPRDEWTRVTLTAARGVVFTDPGPLEDMLRNRVDASVVRGVYLEGNVIVRANEDEYIVRAPKVYYDFRADRAVMVNAILRTYSRDSGMLMYARAKEMRQIAENQWQAETVRVSTSEFATPHLAVGASRMTITRRPSSGDPEALETHLVGEGITMRAGGFPFFYWPRFAGTLGDVPLRSIAVGNRDNVGMRIETTWNLFALLGREAPDGLEADFKLDGFTERGVGTGVEFRYDVADSDGKVDLYGLMDDGTDRTSTGREVEPEDDLRGVALWEHQMRLSETWSFQGQASWISDPTFITSWREDDFETRREYETSAYLKQQRDNAAFTVLAKVELNDFLSNDYLLGSRQYAVEKLPEVTLRRIADSIFGDRITYSSETRLTRMRLAFQETTPAQAGVPGEAFGLEDDQRIDQALKERGYPSRYVLRADTRHEFSMPFDWNIFRIVPFVVGRVTAYDEEFDEFSSDSDTLRFFAAAGVHMSTQFQRVHNNVESRLFDLHRIRHIIEPSVTLWYGYSDVDQTALPTYDEAVESLADGAMARFGLRNTWQTQRGGPGRWRSVDVLTVDAGLVLGNDETDRESPTPQFFWYRPEYSQIGDHVEGSFSWLISDAVSLVGQGTYDINENVMARSSIGAELRHSPVLTTYIEYREIEVSNLRLLDAGWTYQLTPKYRISVQPQWDFDEEDFRALNLEVGRAFPDFTFVVLFRYDKIQDETTVGASIDLARY